MSSTSNDESMSVDEAIQCIEARQLMLLSQLEKLGAHKQAMLAAKKELDGVKFHRSYNWYDWDGEPEMIVESVPYGTNDLHHRFIDEQGYLLVEIWIGISTNDHKLPSERQTYYLAYPKNHHEYEMVFDKDYLGSKLSMAISPEDISRVDEFIISWLIDHPEKYIKVVDHLGGEITLRPRMKEFLAERNKAMLFL
jgi:hypothetical protein